MKARFELTSPSGLTSVEGTIVNWRIPRTVQYLAAKFGFLPESINVYTSNFTCEQRGEYLYIPQSTTPLPVFHLEIWGDEPESEMSASSGTETMTEIYDLPFRYEHKDDHERYVYLMKNVIPSRLLFDESARKNFKKYTKKRYIIIDDRLYFKTSSGRKNIALQLQTNKHLEVMRSKSEVLAWIEKRHQRAHLRAGNDS